MLPYTPLHHLLLRAVGGMPLVMTSGNRSDEPIAYDDDDALERLAGIADLFLTHDRPIHVRCDDSVTRVVAGAELPAAALARLRPAAARAAARRAAVPMLAVGGQLKATFALGRGRHAFLSHHLGDLDHYEAYRAFVRGRRRSTSSSSPSGRSASSTTCTRTTPSTRYAERARRSGPALLAVQHHHAHMASCMAENGLDEPVIGVTFDGTGYGTDGAVWGGEFLVGDYRGFRRAAHLRYVGMPGGEQAIREPWRMAAAHLLDAAARRSARWRARISPASCAPVERMLERRFNTPLTSSAGRLFDAVAALAGVRDRVSYEGQAAIELEWLASRRRARRRLSVRARGCADDRRGSPLIIDTRPLIRGGRRGRAARASRRRSSPGGSTRRWSR